ncbi:putative short-chain dehydrogenase/reductase [Rhizodiscina lignyota]|uniref:Short-chain dehydrogenase/reductase n=1 Tax=Rhizodiscina lignyota TaxID=1504668 RepID=A0A9P4M246_9PEZI|nr:putative short-chain dehydrogenase/reductase [Rhizodiscina lignyota]
MAGTKWALVTGVSAGGMGDAEVDAFLKRKVNVIATAVDIKLLDYLHGDDEKYGASLVHVELDVTSAESIAAAVQQVEKITDGKLDFLINNAGYGYYMPLMDADIEKAKKQYDVNVWGVLAVTQAFFPLLRAAKGTVVNQSSIAGIQGFNRPFMSIYNSSKAAVTSLTDNMRVELSPFDIKVVALITSSIRTKFFENKEGGQHVQLPPTSAYLPIREQAEKVMSGSLSGSKGHDRFAVTRSTIAVLLSRWRYTRYIRRGYGAFKIYLIHLLLPMWLIDRWARQSGGLNKLKKALRVK